MSLRILSLSVAGVLLVLAGCASNPTTGGPTQAGPDRARVVSGAVIVTQDRNVVCYRKKCEACGVTSQELTGSTLPPGEATIVSEFACPKCGKKQHARIEVK